MVKIDRKQLRHIRQKIGRLEVIILQVSLKIWDMIIMEELMVEEIIKGQISLSKSKVHSMITEIIFLPQIILSIELVYISFITILDRLIDD